jgi:hypothetical protein
MKAFPNNRSEGMELRDYLAAQAIPALIQDGMHTNVWELARDAYKIADAMIEIRKENHE